MKFLAGLLAFISSLFIGEPSRVSTPLPPLNTAIIAYSDTFFAPAVAEPGNFPWANKLAKETILPAAPTSIAVPLPPPPPAMPVIPIAPPPPPAEPEDPYLAKIDPIVNWYMPVTIGRTSSDSDYSIPEMTFTREFWRIEALAYWSPKDSTLPIEKDYFKLEVYDKGTDKLIYTMVSGTDNSIHKFQIFKKPGTYYFKIYLKSPSQFEITFTYH